jgi:Raf kinase inhibitor-like YbhB/YbcL family protein
MALRLERGIIARCLIGLCAIGSSSAPIACSSSSPSPAGSGSSGGGSTSPSGGGPSGASNGGTGSSSGTSASTGNANTTGSASGSTTSGAAATGASAGSNSGSPTSGSTTSGSASGSTTSGASSGSPLVDAGPAAFTLTTPAFDSLEPDGGGGDGGPTIPAEDTCAYRDAGGFGVFPGLDWSGAPSGTESFAIVLHDLTNDYYHWAIWDIPATVMSLPEGLPGGLTLADPEGGMQDSIMGGMGQFTGPCPAGALHVYQFTIFAIPTPTLQVTGGEGEGRVTAAFNAASKVAIGTALLTGRSNAKHY